VAGFFMRGRMAGMSNVPSLSTARLPRIRMDANTSSLANYWTREDIKRQGLELRDGMKCVFYDFDAEDVRNGFLHCEGQVRWDEKTNQFRVSSSGGLRFTPSDDLTVLDAEYP